MFPFVCTRKALLCFYKRELEMEKWKGSDDVFEWGMTVTKISISRPFRPWTVSSLFLCALLLSSPPFSLSLSLSREIRDHDICRVVCSTPHPSPFSLQPMWATDLSSIVRWSCAVPDVL